MKIRKAEPRDAEQIAAILKELGWFHSANRVPMEELSARVEKTLEETRDDKQSLTLVAEDEPGQVAAFICAHRTAAIFLSGPELYISALYVRQDARGKGIGGALLEAMREYAGQTGCARLMALNSSERDSSERRFFEKHGFVKRSTIENYILRLT